MSNFLSKIRERMAIREFNRFDLSCDTITTQDFYKMKPVYTREVVPHATYNINMKSFTRLTPLLKPYYGSVKMINRAFFVPYRAIMDGWNEYITDAPYKNNLISSVPTVSNADLIQVFLRNSQEALGFILELPSPTGAEISIRTGSTVKNYKWRALGKRAYDILLSLGYSINWDTEDTTLMSALPLIAYAKVYKDWYRNTQYSDSFYWLDSPLAVASWNLDRVEEILRTVTKLYYGQDYFTSAWDRPTAPNGSGTGSVFTITDTTLPQRTDATKSIVAVNTNGNDTGTPVIKTATGSSTAVQSFTQYLDNALHRATDYIKRHQLAGTRAMDRFKARFGIELSDAKLNRSQYLGSFTSTIEVSDVMNTSGGEDSFALGDYSGKGIGYNDGKFTLKSEDEYGQLIIMSTIEPKPIYFQGRDRALQHIGKLDFYTPEFDGLGVQAIRQDELFADFKSGNDYNTLVHDGDYASNGIFGFTSRYAEYKNAQDRITGDFRFGSSPGIYTNDLSVFHLGRIINPMANVDDLQGKQLRHSDYFCQAVNDAQYDRIFAQNITDYDDTVMYDHFITIHHFEVSAELPMSKMYDDYDWSEDAGREQTIDLGGTQLS